MDHRSSKLMEDLVLDEKTNSNKKNDSNQEKQESKFSKAHAEALKVEMKTLRITTESEKQLFETLKSIYGADFKLHDISEFENKKFNLEKQYWLDGGNLVIKGMVDYSVQDRTPKTIDQVTRQFATSKLETYSFHLSHCEEALNYTDGNAGKALEVLFHQYFQVDNLSKNANCREADLKDFLERRQEEREALQSIYGDMFIERIKNQIWIVQLDLAYLIPKKAAEEVVKKIEKSEKPVCRLFLQNKCTFGGKCRFLHKNPTPKPMVTEEDSIFTLEIRFPEGCKYPYEPPYIYFYKNQGVYPKLNCLRIGKRLYEEALSLTTIGESCIFSVISLLENEDEMKGYLKENKDNFLEHYESLFPPSHDNEDATDSETHHNMGSIFGRNRDDISFERMIKEDDLIQKQFREKQTSIRYKMMKDSRRKLPAWSKIDEILNIVNENQVTIITGETGCGKSTQIPQYLLDDWITRRSNAKEHTNIICTQPRRISAIGVAERVARERDERIGSTVGYQIRLESKISSKTRLNFCTTGILLQQLSVNPELRNVTHVIVDEVHERSAESDLLLMFLKQIIMKRQDFKIILMSATLKAEIFAAYFAEAPILHIPGKTFPVEQIFLEDILERTDFIVEENSKYSRKLKGFADQFEVELERAIVEAANMDPPKEANPDDRLNLTQIFARYRNYSKRVCKNLYIMDPDKINYELVEYVLEWIIFGEHDHPRTGSVLVFLPGFAEIVTLKNQLDNNKNLSSKNGKCIILPLHSSLSNHEQSLVFNEPQNGVRKIVLATNLAETSITIDDCVFVIDIGKMKETRFNSNKNMESLETCWVTRANALQRKGRAGRVMPGVCIHLYTSFRFKYKFTSQPIPEILRIPLEPLILRIQIMHKKKIDLYKTLGSMLEPPKNSDIIDAVNRLHDIGALDSECTLTPLGHHLASLPVNVRIGKLILYGAIFYCLDSALTIAACLSHKNPFVAPFEKTHQLNTKKKTFLTANSDQLTTLKAYKKWLDISSRGSYASQVFADENHLSIRTLQTLADIKHQFLELLVSIGFVPVDLPKRKSGIDRVLEFTGTELNVNNENYKLLQGLLCGALYPNVVKVLAPRMSFQLQSSGAIPMQPRAEELRFRTKCNESVNVHPSSVNFGIGNFSSPYLVFQEKIKTSKIFIREVSMVPIISLILFSGYNLNVELYNNTFILSLEDDWILFKLESHKVGQLLRQIKLELMKILKQKMEDPLLIHPKSQKVIQTIVNVITKE